VIDDLDLPCSRRIGTYGAVVSRSVERMMMVSAVVGQPGPRVVQSTTKACRAALHGRTQPALLPIPASSPPVAITA
jgi:hypothetical protein